MKGAKYEEAWSSDVHIRFHTHYCMGNGPRGLWSGEKQTRRYFKGDGCIHHSTVGGWNGSG
jgi:hypothetical protein